MPGTSLRCANTAVKKTDIIPDLPELILHGDKTNKVSKVKKIKYHTDED